MTPEFEPKYTQINVIFTKEEIHVYCDSCSKPIKEYPYLYTVQIGPVTGFGVYGWTLPSHTECYNRI